jgi:starch phosphorylase
MGETISKVLYPADHVPAGQELRLKQQYFFVAASLQDILGRFLENNSDLRLLPDKVSVQLNDTHPVIAVPELMRLLVDVQQLEWETAWDITCRTMAYTNHTLLPEALECWTVELVDHLLPRHLEIIYEINHRFLEDLRRQNIDEQVIERVSIIQERPRKMVRMAHLAIVGSHSTNGVAALHTELLKRFLVADFYRLFPRRFNNKTNGVTPRRWLKQANPSLSLVISEAIGSGWVRDLDRLEGLRPFADDPGFRVEWRGSKLANKAVLTDYLLHHQGERIDPESMFDVQVKRIHEYKRQLLNLLRVIATYFQLKEGVLRDPVPRTVMIGGKAAPGYFQAKLIVKLAGAVARRINNDPGTRNFLRLVFLENYGVSLAERVIPGLEASGTGNMKFAMNGALTIGTMDGANIEIADAVGRENIFIFGLTADEVRRRKEQGNRVSPGPLLAEVLQSLRSGFFTESEPEDLFRPLCDSLLHDDRYRLLDDFDSYCRVQNQASELFTDEDLWTRKTIYNVAAMGRFSSDRTIGEYAGDIWNIPGSRAGS